jgi:hypothetical protein
MKGMRKPRTLVNSGEISGMMMVMELDGVKYSTYGQSYRNEVPTTIPYSIERGGAERRDLPSAHFPQGTCETPMKGRG